MLVLVFRLLLLLFLLVCCFCFSLDRDVGTRIDLRGGALFLEILEEGSLLKGLTIVLPSYKSKKSSLRCSSRSFNIISSI